jgi:hypothetical protein
MPLTNARVQPNTTPGVKLVGAYEKDEPLQIPAGVNEEFSAGIGFNLTVTVCVLLHPFAVIV